MFILSIFRRIYLYQQFHGWSLARIYGGIFLLWVLGMVGILVWRHFLRLRSGQVQKKSLLLAEVLLTLGIIIFVGLFNAENFIVSTHPPTVNKRVDYVYLSRMSTDGYEGWKRAYAHAKMVLDSRSDRNFFDSEERREIAYAGMVIQNLLVNSYELAADYGGLRGRVPDRQFDFFDWLYSWNFSRWNAYQKMQSDMPISELVKLQDKYFDYYRKISSQPESERGFEMDISPGSPFFD
ncbi:hypothetical protein A2721_02435 [Candidatus Gottesmanbacteria bacterium RIFCSPHIGHO2_01_FULL_47_48]|uniref:Uncharacterized protein n=1 Tax=Candidatus Gottesmanbacteria bacterium RIFCSPHIGHO2_01_FULL_47_48 TaxID=1798381 RepID=A0A1F6A377_9BACT|nr:MAG: hypothetical protein A2721_02435 [Candidatus Gottesmanbacteria bacterium RIFCSPHIGHO2_01_FULL_47_48]